LAGLAGKKFQIKNLFQLFFKMKTFTPSSSKNILLFFMKFLVGQHHRWIQDFFRGGAKGRVHPDVY